MLRKSWGKAKSSSFTSHLLGNATEKIAIIVRYIYTELGEFEFEWGSYAQSASEAIFRARTYNPITYSASYSSYLVLRFRTSAFHKRKQLLYVLSCLQNQ